MPYLIAIFIAVLALLVPTDCFAQSRQYRELATTDGRIMKAEILRTESTGLLLVTPQGKMLLSFELLMDMKPIQAEDMEDPETEKIWIYAPGYETQVRQVYSHVPNLEIMDENTVSTEVIEQLQGCAFDFECMREVLKGQGHLWMVTVRPPPENHVHNNGTDVLIVRGLASGEGAQHRSSVNYFELGAEDLNAFWPSLHSAITLIPPQDPPKELVKAFRRTEDPPTTEASPDEYERKRLRKLAFVPIPGFTWLAQGKSAEFAVSLSGTAAATGLLSGTLSAKEVDTAPAMAITFGSFYAANLVINHLAIGSGKSGSTNLSIIATPADGGGNVVMSGRF